MVTGLPLNTIPTCWSATTVTGVKHLLLEAGYGIKHLHRMTWPKGHILGVERKPWPPKSFAPVHIIFTEWHAMVWDGRRVFDPGDSNRMSNLIKEDEVWDIIGVLAEGEINVHNFKDC